MFTNFKTILAILGCAVVLLCGCAQVGLTQQTGGTELSRMESKMNAYEKNQPFGGGTAKSGSDNGVASWLHDTRLWLIIVGSIGLYGVRKWLKRREFVESWREYDRNNPRVR